MVRLILFRPWATEAVIVPSIRDILNAFEDPASQPELLERLRAGDPGLAKNWDVVKSMFGGLSSPSRTDATRDATHEVRPGLRDMALRIFDATAETTRQLLLPTRVPEVATALRGSPHTRFHELFEIDGHEIDLAWMDDEMLVGQLATPDSGSGILGGACILYGGEAPRQVALEPMGEFEIPAVRPGAYELAIETRERLFVIPQIELTPR